MYQCYVRLVPTLYAPCTNTSQHLKHTTHAHPLSLTPPPPLAPTHTLLPYTAASKRCSHITTYVEAQVDHCGTVFCCVYAVQYGPRKHEHCYTAHGTRIWVEQCHCGAGAVFFFLVRGWVGMGVLCALVGFCVFSRKHCCANKRPCMQKTLHEH